jgi:hypothetical protein
VIGKRVAGDPCSLGHRPFVCRRHFAGYRKHGLHGHGYDRVVRCLSEQRMKLDIFGCRWRPGLDNRHCLLDILLEPCAVLLGDSLSREARHVRLEYQTGLRNLIEGDIVNAEDRIE